MSISAESRPTSSQKSKPAASAKAKAPPPRVPPFHTDTPEDRNVYHDHRCAAAVQIHDPKPGTDGRPLCGLCAHYGYGRYTGWVETYGKKAADLPANQETLDGYLARKAELEQQPDAPAAKKELGELTAKIEKLQPVVNRQKRVSDRAQHFNAAYKEALDAATATNHTTDEVELLADIIMNEAADKTVAPYARRVLAYAWINRKGSIAQPIYEKKGQNGKDPVRDLSYWDQREIRFRKFKKEYEREWYVDSLTDSLKAVTERITDPRPQENDKALGATHWYSPDNLAEWEKTHGRVKNRWWEHKDEFEEVPVPGVPTGQFRFYKKVKPAAPKSH